MEQLTQNTSINVPFVTKNNILHSFWEFAFSRNSTPNCPKNLFQNLLFSERLSTNF